jgi:hypothetical protein
LGPGFTAVLGDDPRGALNGEQQAAIIDLGKDRTRGRGLEAFEPGLGGACPLGKAPEGDCVPYEPPPCYLSHENPPDRLLFFFVSVILVKGYSLLDLRMIRIEPGPR